MYPNLEPIGSIIPATESQTRELSKAPAEQQAEVWQQAQDETGKEQPTAQEIKEIVSTGSLHVSQGNNDWYTPSIYIESARTVMGNIDVDPASSDIAQETVQAKQHYTIDNCGLDKDWLGNVWLNPPYSHPEVENFTSKAVAEFTSGNCTSAIVLTNNATDTKWFHELLNSCNAVCITAGRISFIDSTGEQKLAARQGQFFFYFGEDENKFSLEFTQYGKVLFV